MQIKLGLPHYPEKVPILEKFCAKITLAICIIPDESILNQLEVVKLNVYGIHLFQYQIV